MSIESDNTVSNVLSVSAVRLCCRLFVQLSVCVDGRLLSVRIVDTQLCPCLSVSQSTTLSVSPPSHRLLSVCATAVSVEIVFISSHWQCRHLSCLPPISVRTRSPSVRSVQSSFVLHQCVPPSARGRCPYAPSVCVPVHLYSLVLSSECCHLICVAVSVRCRCLCQLLTQFIMLWWVLHMMTAPLPSPSYYPTFIFIFLFVWDMVMEFMGVSSQDVQLGLKMQLACTVLQPVSEAIFKFITRCLIQLGNFCGNMVGCYYALHLVIVCKKSVIYER